MGSMRSLEFIAVSKADLNEILTTSDSRVITFQKGVHGKNQIEAAFKSYRKDFSFDRFETLGVH